MGVRNIKFGFILIVLLYGNSVFSQVGIGIASPNGSAMLDVTSTTKGFLPPRLTTAERATLKTELLTTPDVKENGMLVFDTTLTTYYYWNGIDWQVLANAQDVVDKTNNQTDIAGNKTFTNDVTVDGTLTPKGRLVLPMGELSYFSMTGTDIVMASTSTGIGSNNMVQVIPASASFSGTSEFEIGINNGSLKYTGLTTRMFHIAVTVSGTPEVGNNVFVFGVAKDGAVIESGKVLGSSSGTQFSSLHIMLWLDSGQELSLWIGNTSASKNFTAKSLNFFAMGM